MRLLRKGGEAEAEADRRGKTRFWAPARTVFASRLVQSDPPPKSTKSSLSIDRWSKQRRQAYGCVRRRQKLANPGGYLWRLEKIVWSTRTQKEATTQEDSLKSLKLRLHQLIKTACGGEKESLWTEAGFAVVGEFDCFEKGEKWVWVFIPHVRS